MIIRTKTDTFYAKHWLGIRYVLSMKDGILEPKELISQYLFLKDILDIGISFYDIEEKGHAYYDIQHNIMSFSPNLKQLLHIIKQKEILTDVYEQIAKMLSLIILGVCIFMHIWPAVIYWLFLISICKKFKYIPTSLIMYVSLFPIYNFPVLIPVLLTNIAYINKIKGDYIYDLFVCHSRRYRW